MPRPLALLLLTACATTSGNVNLTLQEGQTGKLRGKNLTVQNVQDNRCPPTADCIRAGEIITKVQYGNETLTLQLPEEPNTPWAGIRIREANFDEQPRITFTTQKE